MSFNMEFSYPREVETAKREHWPVLLPVGNLEYHSEHCPFGCDTLMAMGTCRELAKEIDCMILPPVWYGPASYAVGGPDKNTIHVDCDVLEAYVYQILRSLFRSGFTRNICIVIMHQTEEFLPTALACMKAAKKLTFEWLEETQGYGWWGDDKNAGFYDNVCAADAPWNWIRVFNGARYPEEYSYNGDHAGKYECSGLEYLFPGTIKLERLDKNKDWFAQTAAEMSVEEGKELVMKAVSNMLQAIREGKKVY